MSPNFDVLMSIKSGKLDVDVFFYHKTEVPIKKCINKSALVLTRPSR